MDWWQILFLILAFVIIGGFLGVSLSYFMLRFVQKRDVTFFSALTFQSVRGVKASPIREWRTLSDSLGIEEHLTEKPVSAALEEEPVSPAPPENEPEPPASALAPTFTEETPNIAVSSLLAEVKHNYEIANQPLGDKLSPFETSIWDKHFYEIEKLPQNIREDLEQAYIDIRLVNSLVWLSNEFGRRTPELERNYTRLCNNIIGRLDRIVQSLELRLASK